jgi:hypothetical protein
MTPRRFDLHTSITRRPSCTQDRSRRSIARIAWLLARFIRRESVRYELYEARFGASLTAFRSDIGAVRAARIYRGTELLGSDAP